MNYLSTFPFHTFLVLIPFSSLFIQVTLCSIPLIPIHSRFVNSTSTSSHPFDLIQHFIKTHRHLHPETNNGWTYRKGKDRTVKYTVCRIYTSLELLNSQYPGAAARKATKHFLSIYILTLSVHFSPVCFRSTRWYFNTEMRSTVCDGMFVL